MISYIYICIYIPAIEHKIIKYKMPVINIIVYIFGSILSITHYILIPYRPIFDSINYTYIPL